MLSQIRNVVLEPFEVLDLPVVFVPNKMTEHKCLLEVHAVEHKFKWSYPVVGTAEAALAVDLGRFTCKARESLMQHLDLPLDGAGDLGERERLDIEVITPDESSDMLTSCLTIEVPIPTPSA